MELFQLKTLPVELGESQCELFFKVSPKEENRIQRVILTNIMEIHRQSLVKITFSNFTISSHFYVKILIWK